MASQQAMFEATIIGMKKAMKRKSYDSDSDSSIDLLTNRGNKLRKRSRYIHEGQLAPPTGPQAYRRKIEHAGFYRDVISRNPPLVDEDGYDVDSEDDDERAQAAAVASAESDPYSEVKIEQLLMPLMAAADLPDHPTLSKPFTSKVLTELTQHAGEMVQKEKASLWRIKHLLTRLGGDDTWIPCESVRKDDDISLFFDERDKSRGSLLAKALAKDTYQASTSTLILDEMDPGRLVPADALSMASAVDAVNKVAASPARDEDVPMAGRDGLVDSAVNDKEQITIPVEALKLEVGSNTQQNGSRDSTDKGKGPEISSEDTVEGDGAVKPPAEELPDDQDQQSNDVEMDAEQGADDQDENAVPRRMRTRAQAASDNAPSSRTRSISPDSDMDMLIHPYFLAPQSSRPDRDVGLPSQEAEETRRLLQLYIQKQEEVCRGTEKIYEGLLRADRYRKLVLKWAKAEGPVGINRDMSDGEDWYDKEEWGLDEDLKKGQDEEEEDAATTAKKTRTRRQ